jgi:LPLT family lysophospholipid transporter-like MFS transporter
MLWSRAFLAVLGAQFLSAIADNALLFAALAVVKGDHYAVWTAPLLQEFFVAAYIVLAPFAGPFSDALPKGRVMLICNGIKALGAGGMLLGFNPFLAYGLVGLGAAAYSPAKYGILSELTAPAQLVRANSWMESSTIAAILIGAVAGGTLSDWSVPGALVLVVACYGAAAGANLMIPRGRVERCAANLSLFALSRGFVAACRTLWRLPDARFSVIGTSLFWGGASTMRFLLVAWVPVALGIATNRMPAYLTGMVAVGIIVGALMAARFITVERADRAMPAGMLIGVALCLLAGTGNLAWPLR